VTPGRPVLPAVAGALAALALGAAGVVACGSDDDGGEAPRADPPVDASLDVEVERLDAGLRITWTVTNDGDVPFLVFDGLDGDEAAGEPVQGAYVTGGDGSDQGGGDGVAEISRRLFPVPDDLEGVQQYGTNASELAPGATASQTENVSLPLEVAPAAPEGGGEDLPDDPSEAVFCLGVGPQDGLDTTELVTAGHWFVPHGEANMTHQTLLCGDPFAI
jgi:hypothetical protein